MKISTRKMFTEHAELVKAAHMAAGGILFQPGEYRITVERVERQRTGEQNKFYWAVLGDIADQTGNSVEDLHQSFRAMFLLDHSRTPARIMSTSELDVRQFIAYLDTILAFVGSEMGISVRQSREF